MSPTVSLTRQPPTLFLGTYDSTTACGSFALTSRRSPLATISISYSVTVAANRGFISRPRRASTPTQHLTEWRLQVSLGGPEIVDGRLLAALRVLLAADSEAVHNHDLKTLMSLDAEAPLGHTVEASALRTVLALCAIALQHFHTKIMEDESILKGNSPVTTELALQFRLQKKVMILEVMQNLSRRIEKLSPPKSTA